MRKIFAIFAMSLFCGTLHAKNFNEKLDYEPDLTYKKLYVDSEKIIISNNQLFLNLDNQLISLHSVFSDAHGVYLKAPIADSWWTCICGWEYSDEETRCQNPDCVLYGR
jgi:hypothetical protein